MPPWTNAESRVAAGARSSVASHSSGRQAVAWSPRTQAAGARARDHGSWQRDEIRSPLGSQPLSAEGPCWGLASWRLAVQSLMGELVDGRAMRASWVVPHSESEIGKKRPVLGPDRPEDHAEAPGWWGQVELGAVGQHGPVVAVLVHAPQVLDGHPAAFIVPSSNLRCLASSRTYCE
jgi:hypothetical protein